MPLAETFELERVSNSKLSTAPRLCQDFQLQTFNL